VLFISGSLQWNKR